jgi:hypothetical protein
MNRWRGSGRQYRVADGPHTDDIVEVQLPRQRLWLSTAADVPGAAPLRRYRAPPVRTAHRPTGRGAGEPPVINDPDTAVASLDHVDRLRLAHRRLSRPPSDETATRHRYLRAGTRTKAQPFRRPRLSFRPSARTTTKPAPTYARCPHRADPRRETRQERRQESWHESWRVGSHRSPSIGTRHRATHLQ